MKLRKLARLCEHDEIKAHPFGPYWQRSLCPGGVFLPDDTLIAITVGGSTTEADPNTGEAIQGYPVLTSEGGKIEPTRCMLKRGDYVLIRLDALSVREAE